MFSQLWQHRSQYLEAQIFFVSQAVSAPLDDANLVVEPFNESQRHFVLWPAVSGNPIPVTLNHRGKFLKGLKPLPFERRHPVLKEAPGPTLALVTPQLTKGLLEQVGGIQSLVGPEQGLQRLTPLKTEVLPARQQRVFLPLDKASIFACQPPVLTFSNLIQRLAQMAHHMKLVIENRRLRGAHLGSVSKRFPHVHDRQANPCALGLSQLIEELRQAWLGAVFTAKPDRSSLLQVAHHNPIRVSFANRYLVDADHLWFWLSRLSELRLHVLLVQILDRMPIQLELLGHILDGRRATPSPHIVSKALGVKRIVRQKLQPLALHFATASTKHPANFQFQVYPRIAARQIPKLTNSAVVPTLLHAPAVATGSFFERRTRLTMRALGSPKTPRTVAVGRNPESAYASHNRRARFFAVAMETPCLFSHYSQRLHSQFPCGFEPFLLLKSTHSITR